MTTDSWTFTIPADSIMSVFNAPPTQLYVNHNLGLKLWINPMDNTLGVLMSVLLSGVKGVFYNEPYTTVKWADGTATTVKCTEADNYSKETGFVYCLMKKVFGDENFHQILRKVSENGKDVKALKLMRQKKKEKTEKD